jgi:hypothetical protein
LVNKESTKFASIAVLFTDVVLLLVMLVGLLRLRIKTGGVFGFGRILWNQVRMRPFSLAVTAPN